MIRLNLKRHIFTFLILLGGFLLALLYSSTAEENLSTLSGRVINVNGEPIAESTVVLLYVKFREYSGLDPLYDNSLYPFLRQHPSHFPPELRGQLPDEQELRDAPPFLKTKTDSDGKFTIDGIVSGTTQLMVFPDGIPKKVEPSPVPEPSHFTPPPEIKAIKFGKSLFYPHPFPFSPEVGAVTFAIKPGAKIQNVEIIMKSAEKNRQEIRGKIIFKDGSPFANTTGRITINRLDLDGTGGNFFPFPLKTDADGNFAISAGEPGIYALSVRHLGLSAFSKLFFLKEGEHRQGLVLTFNGNSSELTTSKPENAEKDTEQSFRQINIAYSSIGNFANVWVINPENGHAYKAIRCDGSREDAQAKAEEEEAHLVTITSEAEQIWLDVVYEGMSYWIGLSYVVFGNKWQWDTGEPLEYSNWTLETLTGPAYPPGIRRPPASRKAGRTYTIMSNKGQWEAISQEGGTRVAIIEKDGLRAKKPDPVE